MIYIERHYWKFHYIVLCFLTPETYPNYPLSHHPSSSPPTVQKRGKPRLHYSSILLMFAAMLAAARKLSLHKHHSSENTSSPSPQTQLGFPGGHLEQIGKKYGMPGRGGMQRSSVLKDTEPSVLPGISNTYTRSRLSGSCSPVENRQPCHIPSDQSKTWLTYRHPDHEHPPAGTQKSFKISEVLTCFRKLI